MDKLLSITNTAKKVPLSCAHPGQGTKLRPAILLTVVVLLGVFATGCSRKEPVQPAVPTATPSGVTPPPQPPNLPPPPPPPPENLAAQPQQPETIQKKAEVGVGKKGRGYGKGYVATPIGSLFAFQERKVFEIEIPHAMNLFKAAEGRAPKDHAEFMEKIIRANNIRLPELPPEHRYRYDPQTEQLLVEQPAEE